MSVETTSLLESGSVRLKRVRHGYMAYLISDRYIGRSFDRYGEFSEAEVDLFRQIIREGSLAIDGGANIGAHSLPLSSIVGPKGAVIAFEPQRIVHQLLCANLALNAVANVRAMHGALGREPGTVLIPPIDYDVDSNFGGLALGQNETGERVPIVTIDSLDLPACHFIKLDVEGMEGEAVAGATETIKRHRPVLYLENDRKEKSEALLAALFALDYRLYWHLPPLFNPGNFFEETENLFDNIVSVNVLGLPKERDQNIKLREIKTADELRDGSRPSENAQAEASGGRACTPAACRYSRVNPPRAAEDSMPFTDAQKDRLLALITEKSFNQAEDGAFELASGATSTFYFDMKPSLLDPEGAHLIGRAVLERLGTFNFDAIGGMAVGGIPIVAAVCALSWPEHPIPAFFVRKDIKERGLRRSIEGNIADNSRVVLVEDVTTTGGSVLKAVDAVEAIGCSVVCVLTLVDRLEGAADNLAARGIPLDALFTWDDFGAGGR